MSTTTDPLRMRRLLDAGRALVGELDPAAVLDRVLAAAREVTGARYAALAILDEQGEVEQLLTLGVDGEMHATIGDLPRGHGVLGVLWEESRPLRLSDIAGDPRSVGVPAGHPAMRNFLGLPILHRGAARGALYLTEKQSGPFTEADEEAAVILADWAATAIEDARLARRSAQDGTALEPAASAGTAASNASWS
jgi:GAF domain-containing protein